MVKQTVKLKKETSGARLAQRSPEGADMYQEARRAAALVIATAKILVRKRFREAIEKEI